MQNIENRLRRQKRGFGMLGMLGVIAICAAGCGALLARSMEVYHASAMGQWRLQALAAAEGAVVVYLHSPQDAPPEIRIGDCVARFEEMGKNPAKASTEKPEIGRRMIKLNVETRNKTEQVVFSARYTVALGQTPSGAWKLETMEKIP
ncbi:MAG: hypothetical protein NTX50_12285 [Candidatus Sumerlaeota bacterium]|nr:hypothetical protein [Candidatus Sumerlaeota bacterium]